MKAVRILFLGDLFGSPGLRALEQQLASLRTRAAADITAVNGENLAEGYGITNADLRRVFEAGAAVVTSGNHIWQREEIYPTLDSDPCLLRPANYPASMPGHGSTAVELPSAAVGFISILGQIRMGPAVDCPFEAAEREVRALQRRTRVIIVDFHAEDVREKEAMVHHLDGEVSAVLGTHTHVQTADERISAKGTAALTDLGMCGPTGSVIGTDPKTSVRRFHTQLPLKPQVFDAPAELNGALLTVDTASGKTFRILRVRRGVVLS